MGIEHIDFSSIAQLEEPWSCSQKYQPEAEDTTEEETPDSVSSTHVPQPTS